MRKLILIALLLVASPAQADRAGLEALQKLDARVATVGHRLAVAAAGLCADARPVPGFAIHALGQYQPDARADAAAAFGLGDRPTVLAVVPGSAAAKAGLAAGDVITAIGAAPVAAIPVGRKADYGAIAALEARLEAASPMGLTIESAGASRTIRFLPERGCPTRFQVIPSNEMNASADGTYVQVSTRIIGFVENDDELAILIAHEYAHNILRHRNVLDQQGVSRGLLRIFGKNPGRIRQTEVEADRLAIWLAARAGYDIAVAPAYWDRLVRATGYGIFTDGTHAGRTARIAIAREEIAAVEALRAAGVPLDPPMLDGR